MYIIYKHTNKITNKSYIGQTKYTIEQRFKQHLSDAKQCHKRNLTRPFHLALLKYKITDWESIILESNLNKEDASLKEKYWIEKYDSYNNGYNATLGGDYLEGYIPPNGDNHYCTDTTKYTFYNRRYEKFVGTLTEFADRYKLKRNSVWSLVRKKIKSLYGWTTDLLYLYFNYSVPDITPPTITPYKKKMYKNCPKCNNRKIGINNKTCIKCRDISGKNNGMYGKKQSKKVKEAVSKRMYNSADLTLRNWIHPIYGIEYNIRTIDLRNKYKSNNLLISHLKKVSDLQEKQHKGWRLYHET